MPTADAVLADICETDSVQFTDQSTIAQGAIASWEWDMGNGQTPSVQTPPYQSYAADGFYPVQITVTSDSSCVSVFNDTIEIFPAPIANFDFDSVCFPLAVQFGDLSDTNGSYALIGWSWEFTDGQTSAQQSPAIGFAQYGAYGATLTVTNLAGCKDEIGLGDALVHPLPVADHATVPGHCHHDTIVLTDLSTCDILSDDVIAAWTYTLGDGSTVPQPDGTHTYADAGFYAVQLHITTNHGCQDSVTGTVEVYPLPEVVLSAMPQEGCEPLAVQFTDLSTIPAPYQLGSWQWDLWRWR